MIVCVWGIKEPFTNHDLCCYNLTLRLIPSVLYFVFKAKHLNVPYSQKFLLGESFYQFHCPLLLAKFFYPQFFSPN